MHIVKISLILAVLLGGCTELNTTEKLNLNQLDKRDIRLSNDNISFEASKSPVLAGVLNLVPGLGNLYLATGRGGDAEHYKYGLFNLATLPFIWPIAIFWTVPEAVLDGVTLNKKEMLTYYLYDERTKPELNAAGIRLKYNKFYLIDPKNPHNEFFEEKPDNDGDNINDNNNQYDEDGDEEE